MDFTITALSSGQVKITNDENANVIYLQNGIHTAQFAGEEITILNLETNTPAFVEQLATIVSPVSNTAEELCDILNASPYFFKSAGGGGGGATVGNGTIDYSTLRWDIGAAEWIENPDLLQRWQDINVLATIKSNPAEGIFVNVENTSSDLASILLLNNETAVFGTTNVVDGSEQMQLQVSRNGTSGTLEASLYAADVNNGYYLVSGGFLTDVFTSTSNDQPTYVIVNAPGVIFNAAVENSVAAAGRDYNVVNNNTLYTSNFEQYGSESNGTQLKVSADYTIDTETRSFYLLSNAGVTITMPTDFTRMGQKYYIKNITNADCFVDPGVHSIGANTIDGSTSVITLPAYSSITLIRDVDDTLNGVYYII